MARAGGGGKQGRGGGPRQPLSRQRPKAAAGGRIAKTAAAKRGAAGGAKAQAAPARAGARTRKSPHGVLHQRKRRGMKRGAALKEHAAEVYARLIREYPDAHCALDHRSAYQLLVATILSAQTTDKRVNMVTPGLFARYPTPGTLANAKPAEVEEIIRSTGFFRSKAKSIIGMATALVERHGGDVPHTMEDLVQLPGVGRKTANVVLGNAFDINEGVVVDTHVTRLSQRLGLTRETDAVKIEQALIPLFPRERWTMLSHLLIEHGRQVCDARKPRCEACVASDICPSSRVIAG